MYIYLSIIPHKKEIAMLTDEKDRNDDFIKFLKEQNKQYRNNFNIITNNTLDNLLEDLKKEDLYKVSLHLEVMFNYKAKCKFLDLKETVSINKKSILSFNLFQNEETTKLYLKVKKEKVFSAKFFSALTGDIRLLLVEHILCRMLVLEAINLT